jgi:ABC-type tungstate transport system substrate-binding protein
MWYLGSFVLLFVGCALCCAGELWAVVLYVPFVVGMVWNEIDQSRQRHISRANSKTASDKQNQ